MRAQIKAQRSRLAAAETSNARGRQAIKEAFVAWYRRVLWVVMGLALAVSQRVPVTVMSGHVGSWRIAEMLRKPDRLWQGMIG